MIRIAALAVALSIGLLATEPAHGDVGVGGLAPRAGAPGDPVQVSIVCGWCASSSIGGRRRPPAPFPVSLVPVARAPKPHPCMGGKAVCGPFAAGPPRHRPFAYLGKAKPVFDLDHPPENVWAAKYRLRFRIPRVRPGPYAFVIYLGFSGDRGGLAVDSTRYLLHVRPADSVDPAATGTGKAWWIAGGAALFALAGGAVLLGLRWRHERAMR
jgi:hypothetical protein